MASGKKKGTSNELDISSYDRPPHAREFMRMWSDDGGGAICFVDPAALGADPFLYGIAIVDAIRHGANAYAQAVNITPEQAFDRIMEGFSAEMEQPTDMPKQVNRPQ